METLYIDTSIFEANNFFEGHRIKGLFKLAKEKKVRIIIPELTFDEIKNRLKIKITEAHKKFRNDHRVLRNIPSLQERFESFDLGSAVEESANSLQKIFNDSNIEVVQYPELNIGYVFKNYFATKYPFNTGKKKNEFPDAFALNSIEKWATEEKTKVTLFSKDKDLLNYKSDVLIINDDFDAYIDEKIREDQLNQEMVKMIDEFISQETSSIITPVKNWFEEELDYWDKYLELTNYLEIHNVEIDSIEPEIEGYEIMELEEDYAAVQIKLVVNFKVILTIDDEDYMIKDEDTKEWIYMETTSKSHEDYKYVDLNISIFPSASGATDMEVEEINHGQVLRL